MSSRIPPPNSDDSRYTPRDRSQGRFDRRSSAPYGGGPLAARISDPGYRPADSHSYSGPGRDLPREPPRGPKALIDGPRGGGSFPRGRSFGGRGDVRDRDFRDARDSAGLGRGRERDWGLRDTYENRERRPSPTGRNRSRSPAPRDLRDPREFPSREVDQSRMRRGSRDGPLSATSSISDAQPSNYRGRGGYRGRIREDWDQNRRGRGGFNDEREGFRPRSRSRDRAWDRNRERDQDISRREDDTRKDWDIRDRDPERHGREQPPFRPDSRNSTSTQISPLTPHPSTATSLYQANAERFAYNSRSFSAELGRRGSEVVGVSDPTATSRDVEKVDLALSRPGRDRPAPGTVSPPPQAPQVPAFGSIAYRTPSNDQSSAINRSHTRSDGQSWIGSQNATRDIPSVPKAAALSNAPSRPKAAQKPEKISLASAGGSDHRKSDKEKGSYAAVNPAATTSTPTVYDIGPQSPLPHTTGLPPEAPVVYAPRRTGPGQEPRIALRPSSTQPLHAAGNRTIEGDGRQTNSNISLSSASISRPNQYENSSQTSPAKIPTGPKAERSALLNRQIVAPSIRASQIIPTNTPPRQPRNSNWKWVRPGLGQHTPRGPSIMNTVPTKREFGGEGRFKPTPADSELHGTEVPDGPRAKSYVKAGQSDPNPELNVEADRTDSELEVRHKERRYSIEERISINEGTRPLGASIETPETRKSPESDDIGMEEGLMELDEGDILEAEQKFRQQIEALEARRPPTPRHHPLILQLLEECDALATAAEEISRRATEKAEDDPRPNPLSLGLPSPKLEGIDQARVEKESLVPMLHQKTRRLTPPLENLPFLVSGLPSPFSELEDLQEQIDQHDIIKAVLVEELLNQRQRIKAENNEIKNGFATDYRRWRIDIEVIEGQSKSAMTTTPEPNPPAPAILLPNISTPNIAGGRRTTKNITPLIFERIIQDSVMDAEKDEDRRNRERNLQAKDVFNPEKEADVPDMLDRFERKARLFGNTTHLIDNELVLDTFGFIPKQDDFTPDEHETFLDSYLSNPKKWGMIAECIPGRDYQDCVLHYYHTKGEALYKEKEKAFSRIAKKGGRKGGRGLQGRPKSNALMPLYDGAIEYDAPQIPVTDTGRPRRAAAPTFGDNTDPELATPAATPSRRNVAGNKAELNGDSSERPSNKRTRTAPAKEKVAKRGKVPILAAAPGPSPQKADKEIIVRGRSREPKLENEQRGEEIEGAQVLAGLHSSQTMSLPMNPPTTNEVWLGMQSVPPSTSIPIPKQQQTAIEQPLQQPQPRGSSTTTSSYWSVPEQTDFQNLIHHFGTDWQAIANTMKSKTPTMVCKLLYIDSIC